VGRASLRLRPLSERDWPLLEKWNTDPRVLYYAEAEHVTSWGPDEVRRIYRQVCWNAHCFIIEFEGMAIGECWLQRLNLSRVLEQYPDSDCRRIDLVIGEREFWGRGIGTETIRMLTRFAFIDEGVDAAFALDVWEFNLRSIRAFEKAGFRKVAQRTHPPGAKARRSVDLAQFRDEYFAGRPAR